jgi:hypothetical protein
VVVNCFLIPLSFSVLVFFLILKGLLAYGCMVIQGAFSIPNTGQCLPHQFASKASNITIYDTYKPEWPSLFVTYERLK